MRASFARYVVPVLAAILSAGAFAGAQDPGGMGHGFADHRPPFEQAMGDHGHWWDNPRMIERLKLSDGQRKTMDQILYQHREKLIDLQADLERSELAMEPLMNAGQPDRAAMEAQIDKIVAARAALEKANAMFLLDIRMQLTADQWKQLKDMRGAMMERHRMMERHGMMGPGGERGRMWHDNPDGQNGPPPPGNPPDAGTQDQQQSGQQPSGQQQPQQQ